jgi:hypothetical protein
MDQAKHVAFHTPNPKVLKHLGDHYNITDKLSWLPNTVGNLGPASCVTNLHYRLYKSGTVTDHGDTIYGFALGAALGQLDGVYLLTARDTTRTPPVSMAMATSSDIVNAVWEMLYRLFSNSVAAPSPSTTNAFRRLSRQVSNINTSLDKHVTENTWLGVMPAMSTFD